jgi:hypothetical protein
MVLHFYSSGKNNGSQGVNKEMACAEKKNYNIGKFQTIY